MPSYFVIQPFDDKRFDKRYTDVFQPAIKAADLAKSYLLRFAQSCKTTIA